MNREKERTLFRPSGAKCPGCGNEISLEEKARFAGWCNGCNCIDDKEGPCGDTLSPKRWGWASKNRRR